MVIEECSSLNPAARVHARRAVQGGSGSVARESVPRMASFIFCFFSYSARSLPSRLCLYRYSRRNRMLRRLAAVEAAAIWHKEEERASEIEAQLGCV